ncbi:MAG TPA: hypothetical protein VL576_00415 [Candidatus Paceibacterota bacterium]|jgi:glutathione synthase/RimK-type ligase-like ATP-grasp enzyme|nr:hypothetical protein [Candidatus Paceibacterota bacterium]
METTHTPRNIIMWLKSKDNVDGNFQNAKSSAYHKFFAKINERDNFRFAYDFESFKGNGEFINVARYENGEITKTEESFNADVIYQYNKMVNIGFDPGSAVITNTPEFRNLCSPKINTYNYMPQFFMKSYLTFSEGELKEAIEKITTSKVVLKPNNGQNGDDVFIFNKDEVDLSVIPEDKLKERGFLVQEFIDTSGGIPGVAKSYHDLRIITHGDRISLCHVRQAPEGSMVSNSHKGASITEIDIDAIPEDILNFYKQVHTEITKQFPKPLYSMDIGVGKDGPKLIELNSHTAFPGEDFKCMDRFIDNLIYHLETI